MRRLLVTMPVLAALVAAAAAPAAAPPLRADRTAPSVSQLSVDNGDTPFADDRTLLTTISPNGDGFRDTAIFNFRLSEPAGVTLTMARAVRYPHVVFTESARFGAGEHTLRWAPDKSLNPRTYVAHLTVVDAAGNRSTYGAENARAAQAGETPVVRIQGIDAAFNRPSYTAGQLAWVTVATDAPSLELRVFRSGPEHVVTTADNVLNGVEVTTAPRTLSWSGKDDRARGLNFRIGDWSTGMYYAQLRAPDGRIGYAPFVVRPTSLGLHRIAVVMPTNTWQAYNFYDRDGDGWGDTWYAGPPHRSAMLGRPYLRRGVPPHYRKYDLAFMHWLSWTGKQVDYLSDSDLASIPDGDAAAGAYDLIVFEGHHEYQTTHEYDVIERFRDLGGNLIFTSANNFFWRVDRGGGQLNRILQWRQLGRPEGRLIGVQYRGNDEGSIQRPYTVANVDTAPWFWSGTDLLVGSFFGSGGIEIDARSPDSPPGTTVLAQIPEIYGPGYTAEMTYYETPAGAKVFAAGSLNFGGWSTLWPVRRMLDNLWARLSQP